MKICTRRARAFNVRYKQCIVPKISGPALLLYSHIYHDYNIEAIGSLIVTATSIANYSLFYVDNYLHQLEKWRQDEARYEEKTDPPAWNIDIHLHSLHNIRIMQLMSAFSGALSFPLIAVICEFIAVICAEYDFDITIEAIFTFLLSLF